MEVLNYLMELRIHTLFPKDVECENLEKLVFGSIKDKINSINNDNPGILRIDLSTLDITTEFETVKNNGNTLAMSIIHILSYVNNSKNDNTARALLKQSLEKLRIRILDIDFLGNLEVNSPFDFKKGK